MLLRELLPDRRTFATTAATLNEVGYTTPTGVQWTRRHVQVARDKWLWTIWLRSKAPSSAPSWRGHGIDAER